MHACTDPMNATSEFSSGICHRSDTQITTEAGVGKNGTYTGYLFSKYATKVIRDHGVRMRNAKHNKLNPSSLFMYLALHNTHAPLEAPWPFVAPYAVRITLTLAYFQYFLLKCCYLVKLIFKSLLFRLSE